MGSRSLVPCLVLLVAAGAVSSTVEQDRAECSNQLVGLATCLPYVGGDAKTPTIDCCTGIKQVLQKSMKCLCILIKDRDDPNLGLKINTTLALQLPSTCHAPTNLTKCIDLLHLSKGSTDAKVFEDFARTLEHSNSTTPAAAATAKGSSSGTSPSADMKNEGTMGKAWLQADMVAGILLWFFTSYQLLQM